MSISSLGEEVRSRRGAGPGHTSIWKAPYQSSAEEVIGAAFKHGKKKKKNNLSFWKLSACLSGSYLNTINKQMILKLQYI